jgi:hypothetical protein
VKLVKKQWARNRGISHADIAAILQGIEQADKNEFVSHSNLNARWKRMLTVAIHHIRSRSVEFCPATVRQAREE